LDISPSTKVALLLHPTWEISVIILKTQDHERAGIMIAPLMGPFVVELEVVCLIFE
jgi:hypothetical protein